MKPARFDYYDPRSLDEALELLQKHQSDGKVLAGGQSLMPLLNMRLARPNVIVDINRIGGLSGVETRDGGIAIGPRVALRALEREKAIGERLPILREAARYIGHPQIRSRGTVCGSLAHADPAAELPALALALDAEFVAASSKGTRTIPSEVFFTSYFTTALEPHEILTETRFPAPPRGMSWSFLEVSRRHGDFALAGVVAGLAVDAEKNSITGSRLVCFGVGPTPVRVKEAEEALIGQAPKEENFRAAAEVASRGLDPDNDVHATAEYRRSVAGTLVRRALLQACSTAGGK
jgi:CO/xanthine dehydrogenase FAD-binding subunit